MVLKTAIYRSVNRERLWMIWTLLTNLLQQQSTAQWVLLVFLGRGYNICTKTP